MLNQFGLLWYFSDPKRQWNENYYNSLASGDSPALATHREPAGDGKDALDLLSLLQVATVSVIKL